MENKLPDFEERPLHRVRPLIQGVFADHLISLTAHPKGHFRVIFHPDYFVLQDGEIQPSKSQWNTLKKKMKRRDRKIFIFRRFGFLTCGDINKEKHPESGMCCFLDFGFFAY